MTGKSLYFRPTGLASVMEDGRVQIPGGVYAVESGALLRPVTIIAPASMPGIREEVTGMLRATALQAYASPLEAINHVLQAWTDEDWRAETAL
jgi:hypothetical protein